MQGFHAELDGYRKLKAEEDSLEIADGFYCTNRAVLKAAYSRWDTMMIVMMNGSGDDGSKLDRAGDNSDDVVDDGIDDDDSDDDDDGSDVIVMLNVMITVMMW